MRYLHIEFDNDYLAKNYWRRILLFFLNEADSVIFNILYEDEELVALKEQFKSSISDIVLTKKVYSSGNTLCLRLTDDVKSFLIKKGYHEWKNFVIEDMAFVKNYKELMATITHEDYLFILHNEKFIEFVKKMNLEYILVNF